MNQQHIGRYEILETIGKGGFATVYRARDTQLGRVVALKVLHPRLVSDPRDVERFLREANMAASIPVHPNVVVVHEVGQEGNTYFIAMEYLPNLLEDVLMQQRRLPVNQAVDIARQVGLGLQAAHNMSITHRDIKPQNILMTADGTPKVSDFGIARAVGFSSLTSTGLALGSPRYMSPEQGGSSQSDARSDVYSLGCVLYRMLTGEVPFDGESALGIVRQHIDSTPRPVRQLRPEIPAAVEQLVSRCLQKDPNRRYQTAGELAQAAERLLVYGVPSSSQATATAVPLASPPTRGTAQGGGRSDGHSRRNTSAAPGRSGWWAAGIGAVLLLVVVLIMVANSSGNTGSEQAQVSQSVGGALPVVPPVAPNPMPFPPTPTFTPRPTNTLIPTPTRPRPTSTPAPVSSTFSPSAPASGNPKSIPPHIFIGTATVDGLPATRGNVITAYIDGVERGSSVVGSNGQYGQMVVQQGNGTKILFVIENLFAQQTATWLQGGADVLNLTASAAKLVPTPTATAAPMLAPTPAATPIPISSGISGQVSSDIPGTPLAIGSTQSSSVDKDTKPRDVYALNLTAGQEVQLWVTKEPGRYLHFKLANPQSHSFQTGNVSLAISETSGRNGNTWSKNFAPAISGTYFLAIIANGSNEPYTVSVMATGNKYGNGSIAGDIPGTPLAIGSSQGSVVDKDTKPRDVYALNLTAGQEVQLRVTKEPGRYLHFKLANPQSQSYQTGNVSLAISETSGRNGDTWSKNFAPAVSGTHYLAIVANGSNEPYTITVMFTGGS